MAVRKISKNVYEIPKEKGMIVPGVVYASEKLMSAIKKDKTLEQVRNVAYLPGIIRASIALSDAHQGYGFPIGGVAAFDLERGIISPGGVGYDINCGVRLLRTNLTKKDIEKKKKEVLEKIYEKVPSGVGRGGKFSIDKKKFNEVLEGGAQWMIEKGYGNAEDSLYTEEEGKIEGANPKKVSERAVKRGVGQLGTLGAGNHFLEVQYVDKIFDEKTAKVLELEKGQACILIHCGSRGLGHQVASDYIRIMEKEFDLASIPDRELIYAKIKSGIGKDYYGAMCCAVNYAFANRQLITHNIREGLKECFPEKKVKAEVVYDVCHNIAKFEKHVVNGKKKEVCVHRKGATRAFGKGRKEIPKDYRKIGQPVLIPGSMGTASYVLIGTKKAEELTFGSSAHGAGRISSRKAAMKNLNAKKIQKQLEEKGIEIKSGSVKGIVEEAPEVYKDIEEVAKVVDELGISKKVARLKPMLVVKG